MTLNEIPPRFSVVHQRPRLHLLLLLLQDLPLLQANKYRPTVHLINNGPGFLLDYSLLFQRPAALFFMAFCPAVTAASVTWQRVIKETCGYSICGIPSSLACYWSKSGIKWRGSLWQTSLQPEFGWSAPNLWNRWERNKTKQTKTAALCQGAELHLPPTYIQRKTTLWATRVFAARFNSGSSSCKFAGCAAARQQQNRRWPAQKRSKNCAVSTRLPLHPKIFITADFFSHTKLST